MEVSPTFMQSAPCVLPAKRPKIIQRHSFLDDSILRDVLALDKGD